MKIGFVSSLLMSVLVYYVTTFHFPSAKVADSRLNRCLNTMKLTSIHEEIGDVALKLPLTTDLFSTSAAFADDNDERLQENIPSMEKISEALERGENALTDYGAAALKEGENLMPSANSFFGEQTAHLVQLLALFMITFAWILGATYIVSKGIEFANWYFGLDKK